VRNAYLVFKTRFAEAIIIFGNNHFAVLVMLHCKVDKSLHFLFSSRVCLSSCCEFSITPCVPLCFSNVCPSQRNKHCCEKTTKTWFSALEEMLLGFTWICWQSFLAWNFEYSASFVLKHPKSPSQKGITYGTKLPQIAMPLLKESLVSWHAKIDHSNVSGIQCWMKRVVNSGA